MEDQEKRPGYDEEKAQKLIDECKRFADRAFVKMWAEILTKCPIRQRVDMLGELMDRKDVMRRLYGYGIRVDEFGNDSKKWMYWCGHPKKLLDENDALWEEHHRRDFEKTHGSVDHAAESTNEDEKPSDLSEPCGK